MEEDKFETCHWRDPRFDYCVELGRTVRKSTCKNCKKYLKENNETKK